MSDPTNQDRVNWAKAALSAYLTVKNEQDQDIDESTVTDLMTDLLHFAAAEGFLGRVCHRNALHHYLEETSV